MEAVGIRRIMLKTFLPDLHKIALHYKIDLDEFISEAKRKSAKEIPRFQWTSFVREYKAELAYKHNEGTIRSSLFT